ncbi:MAG: SGNH/GDSL hydrolase family protein, partial [Acidobacteriota bacterium]|nr:SGNH/GDSL hydrolase family protein [Acidobacteriota bacterium]
MPDQYLHHKMVPDSLSSFRQQDFHYIQRVNNLGMRGRDVAPTRPPNAYRILMLGDSFTMGKGVEDQETFSVLLERLLREKVDRCGGSCTVEVLNGGVDSYAPILSYLQLTRELGKLEPDMVVLNLDVSDLIQEAAYRQIAVRDDHGDIVGVPQAERATSTTERIRGWTERHMFITRAVLFYLLDRADYREFSVRTVVEQANLAVAAHTLAEDTEPRGQQWADVFESLGRIKQYSDQRGIRFLLTIYPWAHQVSDSE